MAVFGPPPASTPAQAVNELLATNSADEPRPTTVVAFEWERLKLLQDSWPVNPQELSLVAPPAVAAAFADPGCFRLSEEEIEHVHGEQVLVQPYWDP